MNIKQDQIRVYRFYIFEGDRAFVEKQLENSITGTKIMRNGKFGDGKISGFTLGEVPKLIEQHECFVEEGSKEENETPTK